MIELMRCLDHKQLPGGPLMFFLFDKDGKVIQNQLNFVLYRPLIVMVK